MQLAGRNIEGDGPPSLPQGRRTGLARPWRGATARRVAGSLLGVALLGCLAATLPAYVHARRPGASTLALSGTVCAQATGKPVAGAQIGMQGHWTTAGSDGTYSLTLKPVSRLPLRAAALGYQSTDVVTVYNPDGSPLSGQITFSLCGNRGLVEAFRSGDGAVRLASFQQLQPGTPHTLVVSGTSSVDLESDAALQLPSGNVVLLALRRHGKAIQIDVPLTAGHGRYLLEINAAAGFALIKLPLFAGIGYAPPPAPAPFIPDPPGATTAQLRVTTLNMINHLRTQAGLTPLHTDPLLNGVSQGHSDDMARHGYIGHAGSNGSLPDQRLQAASVTYTETAEDIGAGDSIQATIEGLMDSPAHRWAILGDFRLIGIGIARAHGSLLMTLDFVR
ncbi:MAG TPA: CAP domain-containing protein [Chloroflexota bacterium]|nr:CAP domain-containing protein [Chloroflexota bacterium]